VHKKASSVKKDATFSGPSGTFMSEVLKKPDSQALTPSGTGSSGQTVEASAIRKGV
jgi:hypothetical protein